MTVLNLTYGDINFAYITEISKMSGEKHWQVLKKIDKIWEKFLQVYQWLYFTEKVFLIWEQKMILPKSTKPSNTNLKIETHAW